MMRNLANLGKSTAIAQYWAGPLFATFLSGLVLIYFFTTHSFERGFPVFFAFLPMAFYYGAAVQAKSEKQLRALQQRIAQLESQAGQPAA